MPRHCQHSSTWGEVVCGFWDDDGNRIIVIFFCWHMFFYTTYGMWECPTSAFVDWPIFPRHSYMACTNRVNPFTRSLKHFPLGLLIENGQNKVFLGCIFWMATVFYCLALLKCSYSYSLFDRFRAENWWFRENLSSVHTHTKTNTMAGMERIDISDLKGLQYLGWTYFISSNHLLPCYLMLLTLLPGWLLISSGSEQCVVWQIYCEFPSRRHIPQKNQGLCQGLHQGWWPFHPLFRCMLVDSEKHQIVPSIFGELVSYTSLQFLGEQKQTMAGWWEHLCS